MQYIQIYIKKTLILSLIIINLIGCSSEKWEVSVPKKISTVETFNYNDFLLSYDSNSWYQGYFKALDTFPVFTDILVGYIFGYGNPRDSQTAAIWWNKYYGVNSFRDSLKMISDKVFDEKRIENIESELIYINNRLSHFIPNAPTPKYFYCYTGFNYDIVPISEDSTIGIALDMYLYPEFKYYELFNFFDYQIKKMRPEYLLANISKALYVYSYDTKFPEKENLLAQSIELGKSLLLSDYLLPETHDSLKIGFSNEDLLWCQAYEKEIWEYFTKDGILFSTDQLKNERYVKDAPSTLGEGLPIGAPPRLAEWLGWQICKNYMKNNNEDLIEFLANKEYRKILEKSKYRP
jgi:hypothetical protein